MAWALYQVSQHSIFLIHIPFVGNDFEDAVCMIRSSSFRIVREVCVLCTSPLSLHKGKVRNTAKDGFELTESSLFTLPLLLDLTMKTTTVSIIVSQNATCYDMRNACSETPIHEMLELQSMFHSHVVKLYQMQQKQGQKASSISNRRRRNWCPTWC